MNTRKLGLAALVLGMFLFGCVTAAAVTPFTVPKIRQGTHPTRWEYMCFKTGQYQDDRDVEKAANVAGQQGWEMTGSAPASNALGTAGVATIWCFKRPL